MNCCGGSSRHTRRVSLGALFIFADGYCFLLFFFDALPWLQFSLGRMPLIFVTFSHSSHVSRTSNHLYMYESTYRTFHSHIFFLPASFHSNHLFPASNQPCAHNHSFSLSYLLSCHFVSHCLSGPDCAIGMLTSDRSTSAPDVCFPLTSSWGPQ